jgi:TRAP-type mannitol/chloroaromatic compound transport system permease small subunit
MQGQGQGGSASSAGTPRAAAAIDRISAAIGRAASWLVIVAVVVSAGNALVRKIFDTSSNAWLDVQWWLFGAVVLLAAPWTLASNEHIRIDVVSSRWSPRTRNTIDILGHLLFLLPVAGVILYTSWDFFLTSWAQNEQSANAGGLPQWPAKALVPLGFALLLVQGIGELLKDIARRPHEPAAPRRPDAAPGGE